MCSRRAGSSRLDLPALACTAGPGPCAHATSCTPKEPLGYLLLRVLPPQTAKLLDAKESGGMYFVDYTVRLRLGCRGVCEGTEV